MGSFSYTCQLTGVPITSGNRAVLIPLVPRDNVYDCELSELRKKGQASLISNDGCNLYFNEFCFPIFGEYNDYGGLENIVEDDNTKVLEKYFKMKIQDIVDVLCDNRKDGTEYSDSTKLVKNKNAEHNLLFTLSSTWIHGDVYDKLAASISKDVFDKVDIGVHGVLDALGFKFIGEDKTERYNKVYEKDGLKINSDGNWLNISTQKSIYDLKSFKKYCTKEGIKIESEEMETWGLYEQVYKLLLPHVKSLKGNGRWTGDRVRRMLLENNDYDLGLGDTFIDYLSEEESTEVWAIITTKDRTKENTDRLDELKKKGEALKNKAPKKPANLSELYFKEIKANGNNFLLNNIVGWHKVKSFYYPTGRFLYPIGCSTQNGDYENVGMLLKCAIEVNNKLLKEKNN